MENKFIWDLNSFVYDGAKWHDYHMEHIRVVKDYALILNRRLGLGLSSKKLSFAALAHDTLKESGLHPDGPTREWNGYPIPEDDVRYVRTNLDVLEEYGLDDYFNSSCQYHALASGIFLRKELGIRDPAILYPVFFHSCPIISIYEKLPYRTRQYIDIIMLSDKLSSSYLKMNMNENHSAVADLDMAVFGSSGNELNYSLGLYLARLISQGKCQEEQGLIATEYYYKKLCATNPLITDKEVKKKVWQPRRSQVLRTRKSTLVLFSTDHR